MIERVVPGAGGDALEPLSRATYVEMVREAEASGLPHLLRVWNFVPRIHERTGGLERYRVFCRARHEAFRELYGEGFEGKLPAASAVGHEGDDLIVRMVVSREPGRHVENPRQVSAFRYPECYGPCSPSFARATVAPESVGGGVYLSGTASVVGHESRHPEDPKEQTWETIRNLEAVLEASAVPGATMRSLRAYLRRMSDLDVVRTQVVRALPGVPIEFQRADICREELLVEIEGFAR